MADVNYATNYQQAVEENFREDLKFTDLYNTPNNSEVQFIGAKTVKVPNITTGGLTDVNRDVMGTFTRQVDNDYETYTLEHDREFRTLVDPMDIDETNMALTIANITSNFNREQKIPEMDKYMASKVYQEYTAKGGEAHTGDVTEDNILASFDQAMENMDDAEVPTDGRILYVTPKVNTALKNAQHIQRAVASRAGGAQEANRSVRSLDEVKVVIVPSSRMKTVYDFTQGAVADDSAQQIQMILIHPRTVYAPQKYEFVSVDEPSASTGGKNLYFERLYWDVFVSQQKVKGIEVFVTEAPEAP